MKVKYIGDSFGVDGLTNGKTYKCIGVEGPFLRVIDDSGEDYLYSAKNPAPLDPDDGGGGKWIIIEDDEQRSLRKAIEQ